MNKDLIQSRFKKHLNEYNQNAVVQKIMAEKVVNLCSQKKYENILELGCGTGFLTNLINQNLEFEKYTAIDLIKECETYIKQINPIIEFRVSDIEEFEYDKYDLIISNAALQWVNDFEQIINKIAAKLKPNGEFIFSTFGKENFKEIYSIMGTGLNYYSESELKALLPDMAACNQEIYVKSFESPKDVLRHLQLTGVNALENTPWTKKDLKAFENAYNNLCAVKPTLTYNPIYIKIINPTVG